MKKNSIYFFIIFIIMIFTATNVSADTITIAINPDSKPFKYYNEEGEFSGIDADVINALSHISIVSFTTSMLVLFFRSLFLFAKTFSYLPS